MVVYIIVNVPEFVGQNKKTVSIPFQSFMKWPFILNSILFSLHEHDFLTHFPSPFDVRVQRLPSSCDYMTDRIKRETIRLLQSNNKYVNVCVPITMWLINLAIFNGAHSAYKINRFLLSPQMTTKNCHHFYYLPCTIDQFNVHLVDIVSH